MKVRVENADLNVDVTGGREPLILIHGIGADLTLWNEIMPYFKDYKVVRYDLRGSGKSDFPRDPPLSVEQWAKDLEELMNELGIRDAHLLGWSLGGIISLQFCLNFPERVKSLVLVGTTTRLQPSAIALFEERAKLAETLGMHVLVEKTFHMTEQSFAPSVREKHPEKLRIFRTMLENHDKDRYAAIARALVKADLTDRLSDIQNPTLIVVGQYDARTPLADSELMSMQMPHSLMKIIPDCGHFYPLEQPEIFSNIVRSFLSAFATKKDIH